MTNTEPVHALNLDSAQQQSFVRFYRNLPEKPAVTVRFFNRSDYYTVHGEDATFAADQLFGTHKVKYMGDEPKLSYLVLSRLNFEKFVRDLLLIKQYRVEVYVKPSQSKNNDWKIEYKGSPGNLSQFEEVLFENNEIIFNTSVMSVNVLSNMMVAVACVNVTEGLFNVSEFKDNELFTELESLLAQVSPKECIIPQGESAQLTTLKNMLERSEVLVAKIKKSDFNSENIDQDLNRLLYFEENQQRNSRALPETNLVDAMHCLQTVINYLNLTGDDRNCNQYKLQLLEINRYVRLDHAAISALNLLPPPGTSLHGKTDVISSVLQVLNKCCTAQGQRLLEQWIKRPLKDINHITERLNVVQALVKQAEVRNVLYTSCLNCVPDLLLLIRKLGSKKASLRDCYRVYQTVSNIPPLLTVLRRLENRYVDSMLIDPISDLLIDMEKYQGMIEQTLDLDLVDRDEFFVKPSFSEELQTLHDEKVEIEEKMQQLFKTAARDLGFDVGKSIKLECTDQHGYFFRVTLKEEKVLRQNKHYKIIDVIKGGVRFGTDELTELNEEYALVNKNYEIQQKNVVTEIFEVAAGYADTLRCLNINVAKIDVLVSFANTAACAPIPYVRPKMDEYPGTLRLKKVRHPCLEMQDCFIPNDVEFEKNKKLLYVITGPNMGGKSTYIRSVGVTVLLAHIGSFVPCAEAEISVVDGILARVGANDSQVKGLSTFMLEMVETSSIIKSATYKSLVLIDELGRGTSTYDGCGIAWSIAQHLATKTKCFTLFATHFHELIQLAEKIPTVGNLHVTAVATDKTITPLYQIREGGCDKSYGIQIARMVDFPQDVIEDAISIQRELEDQEGMKYINDFEVNLKRKVVEDGDNLIQSSLEELISNESNLSDEELLKHLANLKEDVSQKNLFLKGLLE